MNAWNHVATVVIAILFLLFSGSGVADEAGDLLDRAGIQGGLIVHLGCDDGTLTAALRVNERFIVHGLDSNPVNVAKARDQLLSQGLYGPVTISYFKGTRLPFAENMVNLLVVETPDEVSKTELLRVLVPNGTALIRDGDEWQKLAKPWPNDISEWTHRMYDPTGNAVARDSVVASPRRLQWRAGPDWMRHHDLVPPHAVVSAKGRIFYLNSEGPIEAQAEELAGDRWFLYTRDAFNGTLLWKRHLPDWGWDQWSDKWLSRYNIPYQLPKRLVAVGDRVYMTLGYNAPLSALDAATGKVLQTYDDAGYVDEILHLGDSLVLSTYTEIGKPGSNNPVVKKKVRRVDTKTGKVLWTTDEYEGIKSTKRWINSFTRLELCSSNGRVFLVDNDTFVGLDLETGRELWRTPRPDLDRYDFKTLGNDMSTMVAYENVVLFAQLDPEKSNVHHFVPGLIYGFSAKTGETLWRSDKFGAAVYHSQPGVFVIDGLVWFHEHQWPNGEVGTKSRFVNSEDYDYKVLGADPYTGEIKKTINTEKIFNVGHHHRCHRNVATERFLLTGRRGVEFTEVSSGDVQVNHWVRGGCLFGYLPCNGLLYVPQHPCQCYLNVQLTGFNALASLTADNRDFRPLPLEQRLEKGPAYGANDNKSPTNQEDWPAYRHDAARSGATKTAVPAKIEQAWQVKLGGRLTAPVAAGAYVYVAAQDTHTIHALNATNGKTLWRYTADGRIDSPPALHEGLVLFGTRNGWVYALRRSDGVLAWRFLAAPQQRLVGAQDALESAWPVFGSVLVHNGKLYCAAGRNSYLDGGIDAYEMDPHTGSILKTRHYNDLDPKTGESPKTDNRTTPGSKNDVLLGFGDSVFMRQNRVFGEEKGLWKQGDAKEGVPFNPFDSGRQRRISYEGPEPEIRMIASNGFLDGAYFTRTAMSVGIAYGQLLVHDSETAYGLRIYESAGRNAHFYPGKEGYELYASDLVSNKEPWTDYNYMNIGRTKFETRWSTQIPVRGKAMVLAGETLFIAGQPDVLDPGDPFAAFEGRKGAMLLAISAENGERLAEYPLKSPPVFDSLIAANGSLYFSTQDGGLSCWRK